MSEETPKQHNYDKSRWGPGPWDHEPDRLEWRYKDRPMLIVRGPLGALCGYAGVYPGHPFYEKPYSGCVKSGCEEGAKYSYCGHTPEAMTRVHGGLTYSGECSGAICHTPNPGEPEVWWFGFDCSHCDDLTPGMGEYFSHAGHAVYRDVAYVKAEAERLSDQLWEMK